MTENVLNDWKVSWTVEVDAERPEMLKVIEGIVGQASRRIGQVDVGNVAAWKI